MNVKLATIDDSNYNSYLYIGTDLLEYKSADFDGYAYADSIEYSPKRGYFKAGNTKYIISNSYEILKDDYVYEITYLSPDGSTPFIENVEFGKGTVSIENETAICTGSITNESSEFTYTYITLRCDFLDKEKNIVYSTYITPHKGSYTESYEYDLKPGETFDFEARCYNNVDKIDSCTVSLSEYLNL